LSVSVSPGEETIDELSWTVPAPQQRISVIPFEIDLARPDLDDE
jgi:hypothetical protein